MYGLSPKVATYPLTSWTSSIRATSHCVTRSPLITTKGSSGSGSRSLRGPPVPSGLSSRTTSPVSVTHAVEVSPENVICTLKAGIGRRPTAHASRGRAWVTLAHGPRTVQRRPASACRRGSGGMAIQIAKAHGARVIEAGGPGTIRDDEGDARVQPPLVDRLDQCLKIAPAPGDEHADPAVGSVRYERADGRQRCTARRVQSCREGILFMRAAISFTCSIELSLVRAFFHTRPISAHSKSYFARRFGGCRPGSSPRIMPNHSLYVLDRRLAADS